MPSVRVSDAICSTKGCQVSATQVLNDINFQADPCFDFYEYTCGGWLKNATIPESESSVGTFADLRYENYDLMIDILSKTYQESNFNGGELDEKLFKMAKDYYDSCMNEDLLNKLGTKPLNDYLLELQNKKDILNLLIELEKIDGVSTLFSLYIGPDDKDPNNNVLFLGQPDLGLPSKEYYDQQPYVDAYRNGLKKLSKMIFSTFTDDLVDKMVDFEVQLAKISVSLEALQNPIENYNPITIDELQQKYGFIDWQQYFQQLKVPNKLIMTTPTYFDGLMKLFKQTDPELIKSFILLNTLYENASLLNKPTIDILRDMNAKISGKTVDPPRKRVCIQRVNDAFGDLIGHFFVKKAFDDTNKTAEKVKEFLDLIHKTYEERLTKVDWLDATTREKALDKVKKMTLKSMYSTISPNITSPESLLKYYGNLKDYVHNNNQFNNSIAITRWQLKKKWNQLNNKVDKEEWEMYPQEVNAYYSPNLNQIVVPAGILQPPFFDINSMPLSYGGIGVVIGHELTHGFDNTGRLYDGDGNLISWWSNKTEQSFNDKSKCFIDEYSKFSIEDPDKKTYNVNGKMTLGENLADNGGLSVSFEAFNKQKDHLRLPGVDLTAEQLFFVNFGRVWCNKARPEKAVQQILGDVHAPGRARVNGAVQNMPEFAKAFKCPVGSNMNPKKKCKEW